MAKSKKSSGAKVSAKTKAKATRSVSKTRNASGAKKSAARATVKTSPTQKAMTTEGGPVLEYKLFVEDSVRSLEDQVNYYIGKGWAPVGGVVVQTGGNFMQSMVRRQA